MERKMRIAWLMSECVQNEIGKCLQNSKWKKPKQGRASQAIHDIFAIPSSRVYCILSNLPFYFYLFWVWVLNHYPHYFSIKKKILIIFNQCLHPLTMERKEKKKVEDCPTQINIKHLVFTFYFNKKNKINSCSNFRVCLLTVFFSYFLFPKTIFYFWD